MTYMNHTILIFLFSIISLNVLSQGDFDDKISLLLEKERKNLPVEGELLFDIKDLGRYNFSSDAVGLSIAEADDKMDFGKKFIARVHEKGINPWEPQLQTPVNSVPVKRGDILFYTVFIRTTRSESPNDFGKAAFHCQEADPPWNTIGSLNLSLNTFWRKHYIVIEAEKEYDVGEIASTFHLGFLQQEIEIGGILALNLGKTDINLLPKNELFYDGMEADAPWRKQAKENIENYRKNNLKIVVIDKNGKPLPDARVSLKMKDHLYGFGTFMNDLALENYPDAEKYRSHILKMFNNATTPFYMGGNSDNWGWYGSSEARDNYPKLAEWLNEHDMPAKGHVIIWPGWKWMPSFFEEMADDPAALKTAIEDHIETIVSTGKEKDLYEWDVVNEPWINHEVLDILGENILIDWFHQVHELDPEPKLILNEYNIIMGGGNPDFQDNFERLISYLQDEGAPIGGIGMQCHFDEMLPGIPAVLNTLDRFGKFGLPIQITEFDVAIRNEEMQAKYLEDFYTAVFSHPATEKIVMWGYYEKVMWKPMAAMVRSDWTYKPNYHTYMDLVYNRWWTKDTTANTGVNGVFEMRPFKGHYDIEVSTSDTTYFLKDLVIKSDTTFVFPARKEF